MYIYREREREVGFSASQLVSRLRSPIVVSASGLAWPHKFMFEIGLWTWANPFFVGPDLVSQFNTQQLGRSKRDQLVGRPSGKPNVKLIQLKSSYAQAAA